jgi:hypothetical protein
MQTFKTRHVAAYSNAPDKTWMEEREWVIDLGIDLARRLKATPLGEDGIRVDLLKLWSGDTLSRLASDLWLMVDVLFVVSEPREGPRLTDVEFARALGGDGFKAASQAFWDDLRDFYQRLGQPHLSEAIQANRELIHAGIELVRKTVRHLETTGLAALETTSTSGTGSPNPPE